MGLTDNKDKRDEARAEGLRSLKHFFGTHTPNLAREGLPSSVTST